MAKSPESGRTRPRAADGGGWAGLYEATPDHNALIGRSAEVVNFLYATGFSGHGLLQAPAAGEIVRDLCLDRTPPVDVAPLAADRFPHRRRDPARVAHRVRREYSAAHGSRRR
ncbi:FAD-dependent oxidoreductase [Streptomyces massasporeus]|uniref:FAD-dependent oxidoreductase n=1 Tax=Streptomyces massasporeus TaxID=67324 RepID=UPI003F4D1EAD